MSGVTAKALGLDDFELQTRYRAGLQAVAPLWITALAIGIDKHPWIGGLSGLAVTIGLPRLLVNVVRRRGNAAQKIMWTEWGGPPTTQMLRLSDTTAAAADKERWRKVLGTAAHVELPATLEAESSDPADADARYAQIVTFAREEARGDTMLWGENRSYNYERDVYSMRGPARVLAGSASVALAALTALSMMRGDPIGFLAAGLVVNIVVTIGWFTLPSEDRVRLMAYKYAQRLFDVATHQALATSARGVAEPSL